MTDSENRPADQLQEGESPGGGPRRRSPLRFLWALPRWFFSRFGLMLCGAAAVLALVYFVYRGEGFVKQNELEREKAKLEEEIEALRDENRLLQERLERLKNDPAFVEDEARKKLGLIRSGETVYRLSEEPDLAEDFQER